MQLKDIDMAPEELIIKNISDEELDDLLRKEITNKKVGGEQWFRKYENWYEMPAFVNPYKTPYHELRILIDHQKDLYQFTTGKIKIFWGVGIGDSEIIPVSWDLDTEGYSEVYVIDVVPHFIETFIQNLRNLTKEYPNSKIRFIGNCNLFENISTDDLNVEKTKSNRKVHICLGNTLGNFDQHVILSIFANNIQVGHYLLIGYQLNKNINKILQQYINNKGFERLILDTIKKKRKLDLIFNSKRKLNWKINKEESKIEAWYRDILAFQSKKYNRENLNDYVKNYGFEECKYFEYGDGAISLFRRKNNSISKSLKNG